MTLEEFVNQVGSMSQRVYLMYNGLDKWPRFKIGITGQPVQERVRDIKRNHRRVTLIGKTGLMTEKDALSLESRFHKELDHRRIGGEWFKLTRAEAMYVATVLPNEGVK